ncbi:MAG: response regulator [Agathobacter sp.]|nr:response regulator [Agathobacter sp.]
MRESILIVDDDVVSLKLAGMILEKDYEIHSAKSGLDALCFLRRQRVDLILLDVEMPIMNGLKTLEKIRSDREIADIPVIMLTSSNDKETIIDACRMEIIDYVVKPFIPSDLLERVEKAL